MKKFAVLGYPVEHSLSPHLFQYLFERLGIQASYEKFAVQPDFLVSFLESFRKDQDFQGLSVTIPHKEAIFDLLDVLATDAEEIGAVNTVVRKGEALFGYNTDYLGALQALREGMGGGEDFLQRKKVVVLGAGGAAAALVYGCVKNGAEVWILNRTLEKAQKMSKRFGCFSGQLDDFLALKPDLVIQTTSVGLHEGEKPIIDTRGFHEQMFLFDIVYNPLKTPLVLEAEKRDCQIIPGYFMFVYQALEQFKLWFGEKPDLDVQELKEIILKKLS